MALVFEMLMVIATTILINMVIPDRSMAMAISAAIALVIAMTNRNN